MKKFYRVGQDGDHSFSFFFLEFEKAEALFQELRERYPKVKLTTMITSDDRDVKDIQRDLAVDWIFQIN